MGIVCRSFIALEVSTGSLRGLFIEDPGFTLGVHWIGHPEPTLSLPVRELTASLLGALRHVGTP